MSAKPCCLTAFSLSPYIHTNISEPSLLLHSVYFSSEVTYSTHIHLLRAARLSHERELSFLCYSFGFHIIIQKGPEKPVTCRIFQVLLACSLFQRHLETNSKYQQPWYYEKNIFCCWI